MTACDPGDIVLVRFPFTDLSTIKKRPAVVVSPPEYTRLYGDVVLLALTSQDQKQGALALREWRGVGLPKPTWVKPLIGTIAAPLVERRIGHLDPRDRGAIQTALGQLLAASWQRSAGPQDGPTRTKRD
jgi:mRNA interferase MazF